MGGVHGMVLGTIAQWGAVWPQFLIIFPKDVSMPPHIWNWVWERQAYRISRAGREIGCEGEDTVGK